jgi:hypothetical protein
MAVKVLALVFIFMPSTAVAGADLFYNFSPAEVPKEFSSLTLEPELSIILCTLLVALVVLITMATMENAKIINKRAVEALSMENGRNAPVSSPPPLGLIFVDEADAPLVS